MKKAIIVASGSSLNHIQPKDIVQAASNSDATIIAVNGAADWLPKFDYFFTLDPSKKNLDRMNRCLKGVQYYCAYEFDKFYKIPIHVNKLNRISYQGPVDKFKFGTPEYWLHKLKCKLGLSETYPNIHTGNSAYGALGLAYLFNFTHILMLGVDADDKPRMNGEGKPESSLKHLPLLFRSAKNQLNQKKIQLLNGSLHSNITCFPRTTPILGLDWIQNVNK